MARHRGGLGAGPARCRGRVKGPMRTSVGTHGRWGSGLARIDALRRARDRRRGDDARGRPHGGRGLGGHLVRAASGGAGPARRPHGRAPGCGTTRKGARHPRSGGSGCGSSGVPAVSRSRRTRRGLVCSRSTRRPSERRHGRVGRRRRADDAARSARGVRRGTAARRRGAHGDRVVLRAGEGVAEAAGRGHGRRGVGDLAGGAVGRGTAVGVAVRRRGTGRTAGTRGHRSACRYRRVRGDGGGSALSSVDRRVAADAPGRVGRGGSGRTTVVGRGRCSGDVRRGRRRALVGMGDVGDLRRRAVAGVADATACVACAPGRRRGGAARGRIMRHAGPGLGPHRGARRGSRRCDPRARRLAHSPGRHRTGPVDAPSGARARRRAEPRGSGADARTQRPHRGARGSRWRRATGLDRRPRRSGHQRRLAGALLRFTDRSGHPAATGHGVERRRRHGARAVATGR